jgi:hypothetical protein
MKGQRIRLHFGGVDYQSWVYVNGKLAGTHIGGDVAFAYDITPLLVSGSNVVVVKVFDNTASGLQPTGKQTHTVSEGCVYTRTTGIWQSVWLEAVGSTFVENLSIVPDPENSRVQVELAVNGNCDGLKAVVEAYAKGKKVGSETVPVSWRAQQVVLKLSEKHLWEPGAPFLYDVKVTLLRGQEKVDVMKSYFGLRRVTIEGRAILINGKRIFQRLILDQGFYPDGIWTAPTEEALIRDIELSMAAGYNGARLHQKVFEPLFLYHADKMGYLVWGEFPNWGYNYTSPGYAPYINEWVEILLRDRNHPSIIGWCPFNETGDVAGEIQQTIFNVTRAIDPTRPTLETSGWSHTIPNAEVRDDHDYNQDPASFKQRWMNYFTGTELSMPQRYGGENQSGRGDTGVPFMVSEFGGTQWGKDGGGGWGYGNGPKNLEEFYTRYEGLVGALMDNPNMFGFCYTQLTDVEQEHNGLYYYNREAKFDSKRMHAITSRKAAFEKSEPMASTQVKKTPAKWSVLSGAAADGAMSGPYHFTTETPAASWQQEAFDDSAWKSGQSPFGQGLKGVVTSWESPDLFLRRSFEWDGKAFDTAALVIFHDEDTDVYLNGQKIWSGKDFLTSYRIFKLDDTFKKALKKGKNTLAVHTHQTNGGQFIDLALLVR